MPSGRAFASAIIGFILTVFSLGVIPILLKTVVGGSSTPSFSIQLPNFDTNLLLGIAVLAGAFTFAEKLISEGNQRLGGFYGILRYVVEIYYTLTFFTMIGTIVVSSSVGSPPVTVTATILDTFIFLGTLIILGIVLNMIAFLIKIIAPKDFEKKSGTTRTKPTSKRETIAS
jgi:hypothetical protein